MTRLIILGHSGFIGRAVLKAARAKFPGAEIIGFSSADVDLTDRGQVETTLGRELNADTDVVLLSGIKKQMGDNLDNFSANLRMTENVARVLDGTPVRRFLFFSTADVYGEDVDNTAISEDTPVNPRSYYGMAKFASECLLRKAIDGRAGSSLAVLRPPFTYGAAEDQAGIYGPYGFCRSAREGSEIALWGDGSELREFLFVEDLAQLTVRLLESENEGILNPVSGESHSFKEILDVVESFTGAPLKIANRERSRAQVDNGFENARLKEWFPDFEFTPFEAGLRRCFDALAGDAVPS